MSTLEELRKLKDEAKDPPESVHLDSLEAQLGYRLGWHHGMDDAIEIAEEEEEESY